jgi:hypothetical protein
MLKRLLIIALAASLTLALAACGQQDADNGTTPGDPSAGLVPQRGLMEVEGDRVNAVGTLEWIDLEGGFWAVTDGPTPEGDAAEVFAVIANGAEYQDELAALEERDVVVSGTRLDGASIRMSGPEMEMDSVQELGGGPAE